MNPLIAALIGAGIMYLIGVVVTVIDHPAMDDIFVAPINGLLCAAAFIPVLVWTFIKNVIKPVPLYKQGNAMVSEIIRNSTKIGPNLYFHFDRETKNLAKKVFLFRLEKGWKK